MVLWFLMIVYAWHTSKKLEALHGLHLVKIMDENSTVTRKLVIE